VVHLTFNFDFAQVLSVEKNIEILSHDSLQGRLVGSISEKISAIHIANQFKELSLQPFFEGNYFQEFESEYNPNPHDTISENLVNIKSQNVLAYLNNNASRTFVIGAHYDHIGRNEYHQSLENKADGKIHNGADDNASGVAGVIELARIYSRNNTIENVNFIFICFSGEEIGLLGSKKFIEKIDHTKKIDFMLNMDMIGRMDKENQLFIGGVCTSPRFQELLFKQKPSNIKLTIDSSGIGPSDHSSFYLNKIPVLFFHTGSHEDYHKPSDDFEKINFSSLKQIIEFINQFTLALSKENTIEFTPTRNNSKTKTSKYKITLGILPNYAAFGDGLHIDNVSPNKPAELAGVKAGDILVGINSCKITDIYTYMECLAIIKPGETLILQLKRNDQLLTKEITL
jgi:hypothetical protein